MSVVVTAFGFVYLTDRSQSVTEGMDVITGAHDGWVADAVISLDPHLFREGGGAFDPSTRWLTATNDRELARAVRVMRDSGATRFTLLVPVDQGAPRLPGYVPGDVVHRVPVRPDLTVSAIIYHAA
jgi:hypothetical protein